MEIRNIWPRGAAKIISILTLASVIGMACSTSSNKGGDRGNVSDVANTGTAGPRSLVLVLGPGMVRGLVSIGVLKAIIEAKVPVSAVVGCETGAWIGAVYGDRATGAGLDWAVQQIREEDWIGGQGILRSKGKFSAAAKARWPDQAIERSRAGLLIGFSAGGTGSPIWVDSGPLASALTASFSGEPFEEASRWTSPSGEIVETGGCIETGPFGVRVARERFPQSLVIVVDGVSEFGQIAALPASTLEDVRRVRGGERYVEKLMQARARVTGDIQDADWVIRPEVRDLPFFDFRKKGEAVFRGVKAGREALPEIRKRLG